jgi:hypothetical protein
MSWARTKTLAIHGNYSIAKLKTTTPELPTTASAESCKKLLKQMLLGRSSKPYPKLSQHSPGNANSSHSIHLYSEW